MASACSCSCLFHSRITEDCVWYPAIIVDQTSAWSNTQTTTTGKVPRGNIMQRVARKTLARLEMGGCEDVTDVMSEIMMSLSSCSRKVEVEER